MRRPALARCGGADEKQPQILRCAQDDSSIFYRLLLFKLARNRCRELFAAPVSFFRRVGESLAFLLESNVGTELDFGRRQRLGKYTGV
jgi:hypothetical protein